MQGSKGYQKKSKNATSSPELQQGLLTWEFSQALYRHLNSPQVINTAQAEGNCLQRNVRFTLTVFIEWKQSLKFTYVTIFDMDKAQIILGHPYQKLL